MAAPWAPLTARCFSRRLASTRLLAGDSNTQARQQALVAACRAGDHTVSKCRSAAACQAACRHHIESTTRASPPSSVKNSLMASALNVGGSCVRPKNNFRCHCRIVGDPYPRARVKPVFTSKSILHRTIKSILFAANARGGRYLKPNDRVRVGIEAVGEITNDFEVRVDSARPVIAAIANRHSSPQCRSASLVISKECKCLSS